MASDMTHTGAISTRSSQPFFSGNPSSRWSSRFQSDVLPWCRPGSALGCFRSSRFWHAVASLFRNRNRVLWPSINKALGNDRTSPHHRRNKTKKPGTIRKNTKTLLCTGENLNGYPNQMIGPFKHNYSRIAPQTEHGISRIGDFPETLPAFFSVSLSISFFETPCRGRS